MKKLLCCLIMLATVTLMACGKETESMAFSNPIATIEIEGYASIVVELYYDKAPNSVRNFIKLANSGYYDGLIFHRVIEGFMIQGGNGGSLSCKIKGEFSTNGIANDLLHVRGVISMARTSDPNSATSQFFIMHQTSTHLDGKYAAFGMTLSGFETIDAIARVSTNSSDKPLTDIVIKTISVDTKGKVYDSPTCY